MVEITRFIIVIIALVYLTVFFTWFFKRTRLLLSLLSLKKECGAKVEILRFPYRTMRFISDKPDIRVTIGNRVYNIRLYSGGSAMKSVHFASENYSVLYSRLAVAVRRTAPVVWSGRMPLFFVGAKTGQRVRYVPSVKQDKKQTEKDDYYYDDELFGKSEEEETKEENVLIFNPAPSEVSYVTEDKTKIDLAFTGDMLYRERIFTGSSFIRYADRMSREEKRKDRICEK